MYEYQVLLMGGIPVFMDTYPDFRTAGRRNCKEIIKKTKANRHQQS